MQPSKQEVTYVKCMHMRISMFAYNQLCSRYNTYVYWFGRKLAVYVSFKIQERTIRRMVQKEITIINNIIVIQVLIKFTFNLINF